MKNCFIILLLQTFLICTVTTIQLHLPSLVDIIVSLKNILYPKGIYLLFASNGVDMDEYPQIILLEKQLSSRGVRSSAFEVDSFNFTNEKLQNSTNALFVLLFNGEEFQMKFQKISRELKLSSATWLLVPRTEIKVNSLFSNTYIPFDCELMVVQQSSNHVSLTEVYQINESSSLLLFAFGNWTATQGFKWCNLLMYKRRGNLGGHTIKVGFKYGDYVNPEDFLYDVVDRTDGVKVYFSILWAILEKILNFKSIYLRPADNNFGALKNGTWNGLIGMIVRKEIEIAVDGFLITAGRMDVVQYMRPLFRARNRPFIRKPETFERHWGDFMTPFSTELWLAVLATLVLLASFLSALYNVGHNYCGEAVVGVTEYGFLDSLFYVFSSFCQQGHSVTPLSNSCRTVYVASYLIGMVLVAAYSASLISHLTVQRIELPFTNFEGLLKDGTYKLGVTESSATFNLFDKSNSSLMQAVYTTLIVPYDLPKTSGEGFKRVCSDHKYAYMSPFDTPLSRYNGLECDMVEIPYASFSGSLTMPIAKDHPLLGLFNHVLLNMRVGGTLDRLYTFSWPRKPEKWTSPLTSVELEEVFSLFSLLIGGMGFAAVTFIFEKCLCYITNISEEENDVKYRLGY
ncbi:Ionotropic receptor 117 [Blattella germanica]|nr:Ionotropic receptor 117 [Blattella germanica]